MRNNFAKEFLYPISICFLFFLNFNCSKNNIIETTSTDKNIVDYLVDNSSRFSLLINILEKTNTDGYLNAYGTYTFFAPTNDAINLWLKDSSYSTIDQVPVNTLNDFVKIHLVKDTLSSSDFTDGKLPSITLYGQYLITDVTLQSGKAYYRINRRALVTSVDNRLGNGLVHEIDHVIVPEK